MAASSSRRRVRATSRVLRMAGSSSASSPASRQEGRNRRVSTSARSGTFQPYKKCQQTVQEEMIQILNGVIIRVIS
jgi:hypothetical protein